ncbi:MAG: hypothetical protein K0S38_249 [Candidatus Paceibacter sp.]|jgi:hypothetical protein|nr:hypothetical protein [Candidatus Paceibacter sp.]
MKDDNKVDASDTIKKMGDDPKEAMKQDYDQTKADMENMKDKMMGDDKNDDEIGEDL